MEDEHLAPMMMTDQARRICDELGVCREEAILYLEAFDWDLDAAMEACRSKTLNFPSLTVESPPEKEKDSPEVPLNTDSQSRNELIVQFYDCAVGSDTRDAISYLERNDWDLQRAVTQFLDERRTTPSQRKLNRKLGLLNSQRYLKDETREGKVPKAIPPLVSSHLKVQDKRSLVKESVEALTSSMSLIQLKNSPEEQLSRLKKEIVKSFRDVVIVASRKAAEACLSHCKWNQEDAVSYFFGEYIQANPEIALSQGKAVGEDSSTETLEEAKSHVKESSKGNDELIDLFVEGAGGVVTRDVATIYLTHSNWNVKKAFSCLLEETTKVQASHGSPNKGYLEEDETESSSSSSNADPTETGAVSEDKSSQVDETVKDGDVEEELSPVAVPVTTIELEIVLDVGDESGVQLWILVKSDQTVRDVHNRINKFRPEDKRDYYFKSDTGVEYRDLDTTVHTITSGSRGSTILHQIYST